MQKFIKFFSFLTFLVYSPLFAKAENCKLWVLGSDAGDYKILNFIKVFEAKGYGLVPKSSITYSEDLKGNWAVGYAGEPVLVSYPEKAVLGGNDRMLTNATVTLRAPINLYSPDGSMKKLDLESNPYSFSLSPQDGMFQVAAKVLLPGLSDIFEKVSLELPQCTIK